MNHQTPDPNKKMLEDLNFCYSESLITCIINIYIIDLHDIKIILQLFKKTCTFF